MTTQTDPFAHHPELRSKIRDPLQSYFRTFMPSDYDERMKKNGVPLAAE